MLKPGGRLAILEFGQPRIPGIRTLYSWYFRYLLPLVGRLVSKHQSAYSYLPASVGTFPPPAEFARILAATGFSQVRAVPLTFGIVYLYRGEIVESRRRSPDRACHANRHEPAYADTCYNPRNPLMYFDFEDYRPDTPTLPRSLTRLEVSLLTIVVHLLGRHPHARLAAAAVRARRMEARTAAGARGTEQKQLERQRDNARFVFVRRRSDRRRRSRRSAPSCRTSIGGRGRWSGRRSRRTTCRSRAATRRRGSSRRRRADDRSPRRRRRPSAADGGQQRAPGPDAARLGRRRHEPERPRDAAVAGRPTGVIADAIRNVQKYARSETLQQPAGRSAMQDFAPSIQFDTKGVEFGPWLRRFVAQIRRNWFIPYAAMSLRGHVVVTFYVHKDGRITDLQVAAAVGDRRVQQLGVQRARVVEPDAAAAAGVPGRQRVLHGHVLLQRKPRVDDASRRGRSRSDCCCCWPSSRRSRSCARSRRGDGDGRASSRSSGRRRPARARSASRSRAGSAARSSAAIRRRSIAASTSAPTRCRSPSSRAFRIT